jgi:16S rRNA (guanine966-N2)-methyltransferase
VREALFSGLEARGVLGGAKVIDLFAGSGALGLEAASRGAAEVVLVDSSREAAAVARRNAAALGLPRVAVVLASAQRFVLGRQPLTADLVFLDPPYALGEEVLAQVLTGLVDQAWLSARALVVVERSTRSPEPRWPDGLAREGIRRYGETSVWTAAAEAHSAADGAANVRP